MAQVQSPLFSLAAKGQLASTAIFQEYDHRTYTRAYGKPNWTTHPPTAAQLAIQALTKQLMQNWPAISPTDQATWDVLARRSKVSRINAYLKTNYARDRAGLCPIDAYPPAAPFRVYSGGTITPDLDDWLGYFNYGGTLSQRNNSVLSTEDLLVLEINTALPLDGLFDLRAFYELEEINFCGTALTQIPLLNDGYYLYLFYLINQAFTEVDSLFNKIAATHSKDAGGIIDVSGGTSAAPTTASAAARDFLTDPSGNWTITTN